MNWPTTALVVVGVGAIIACAVFKVSQDVIAIVAALVATAAGISPPVASRPSGEED